MKVKYKLLAPLARAPQYQLEGSSGMDLHAAEDALVPARGRALISTGIAFEIPIGLEGQVRPRSGLALKSGITVLNTPGTIDALYTGECKVILYNTTDHNFEVKVGHRIAQIVFARVEQIDLEKVEELADSARGIGGFGSTGK